MKHALGCNDSVDWAFSSVVWTWASRPICNPVGYLRHFADYGFPQAFAILRRIERESLPQFYSTTWAGKCLNCNSMRSNALNCGKMTIPEVFVGLD